MKEKGIEIGSLEAKYARAEASRKEATRKFNRCKNFIYGMMFCTVTIEIIMGVFIRFCEGKIGESCITFLVISMTTIITMMAISWVVMRVKENDMDKKKKKAYYYYNKLVQLY